MKTILTIIGLVFSLFLNSQNLIVNSSFEDTIPTTSNPNWGGVESAPPWFTQLLSPDYMSAYYYQPIMSLVPSTIFGYQFARNGGAYIGVACYEPYQPFADGRELFACPIIPPLILNHTYYLEFYVSCADSVKYATDGMGAYFSVDTPKFNLGLNYSPQVYNPLGNILNDKNSWIKIFGNYLAQGGEKVMTIGNLFKDSFITIDTINLNAGSTLEFSYYYIDDVTLIDCTAIGMAEIAALDFQLLNNPIYDALHFTSYQKISGAYITDMLGNLILQNEFNDAYFNYQINVATLPRGIYLLSVVDKNKRRVMRRFLKM